MENRKKIVVLDGYTLCAGELNFDALREFGEVTVYDRVAQEDVAARIGDAQIVLTNKALITAEAMDACPRMEYVGVTATGYNVVDAAEAKRRGIVVTNAPAYSTQAVAQHTFALLLESLRSAYNGLYASRAGQAYMEGLPRCQIVPCAFSSEANQVGVAAAYFEAMQKKR